MLGDLFPAYLHRFLLGLDIAPVDLFILLCCLAQNCAHRRDYILIRCQTRSLYYQAVLYSAGRLYDYPVALFNLIRSRLKIIHLAAMPEPNSYYSNQ